MILFFKFTFIIFIHTDVESALPWYVLYSAPEATLHLQYSKVNYFTLHCTTLRVKKNKTLYSCL